MEKGNAAQFKNKSLDEIEIDMENIDEDMDISDEEQKESSEINKGTVFIIRSILSTFNLKFLEETVPQSLSAYNSDVEFTISGKFEISFFFQNNLMQFL